MGTSHGVGVQLGGRSTQWTLGQGDREQGQPGPLLVLPRPSSLVRLLGIPGVRWGAACSVRRC